MKRDCLTSVYQKIYLGNIAARHTVENTFALRIMFKKLAESVKQPLSFIRIADIISLTGAKVGTQTIINYIEYAKYIIDLSIFISVKNLRQNQPNFFTNIENSHFLRQKLQCFFDHLIAFVYNRIEGFFLKNITPDEHLISLFLIIILCEPHVNLSSVKDL